MSVTARSLDMAYPDAMIPIQLVLASLLAAPQAAPLEVNYRVQLAEPGAARLELTLDIDDLPYYSGPLMLAMGRGFSLARLEGPALLRQPQAKSGAGEDLRLMSPRPFVWLAVRPEDGQLNVTWSVPSNLRGRSEVLAVGDSYEWPFMAKDHGLLHTASLLMIPVGPKLRPRVEIDLPEGWQVASSWPRDDEGFLWPPSRAALGNDYLAIGNWSRREFRNERITVTVVAPVEHEDWLEPALGVIERLVPAELEVFGVTPAASFLFVLESTPAGDLAGSAKSTSLVLAMPAGLKGGALTDSLTRLVAHEFFHTWEQSRFASPPELRWFQEGFCDYYAYLISARLELLSWTDFTSRLADCLELWTSISATSEMTLESAGNLELFSTSRRARDLVYGGGMALAALTDRRIRAAQPGASLDEFMRALYNNPRWGDPRSNPGKRSPTPDDFEATLARFVGAESAAELLALSRMRETPKLVQLFRDAGADIASEEHAAKPHLDATLKGTTVTKIEQGGLAQKLGLLVGDELLVVNGSPCDSREQIERLTLQPSEGRMQCSLKRGGQTLELTLEIAKRVIFLVDPRPWKQHQASPAAQPPAQD